MTNQSISPLGRHVALGQPPSRVVRATETAIAVTQGDALVARVREQARGQLTAEAVETAGALSALEGHLIEMAPLGEARYKALIDAYTLGAARAINGL